MKNSQEILQKYGTLLEQYRQLKSDYKEEWESRERYKKVARGQERNPFIMILIDGANYIIHDHLVQDRAEGGTRAAQFLSQAVQKCLLGLDPDIDQCHIVVWVYADTQGLSISFSQVGLAGKVTGSLSLLRSSFTGSVISFHVIDTRNLNKGASSKIAGMLARERAPSLSTIQR